MWKMKNFHDWGSLRAPNWAPGSKIACWRTVLKAHMARRTCFKEQYYTGTRNYFCAGKIGGSDQIKLYINLGWFFIDDFWLMCSFGLGFFVDLGMVSLYGWEPVRCPGKFICENLNEDKVMVTVKIVKILWLRPSPGSKFSSAKQNRVLTHSVESPHDSKNLLQRSILYRHKESFLRREDWRSGQVVLM